MSSRSRNGTGTFDVVWGLLITLGGPNSRRMTISLALVPCPDSYKKCANLVGQLGHSSPSADVFPARWPPRRPIFVVSSIFSGTAHTCAFSACICSICFPDKSRIQRGRQPLINRFLCPPLLPHLGPASFRKLAALVGRPPTHFVCANSCYQPEG